MELWISNKYKHISKKMDVYLLCITECGTHCENIQKDVQVNSLKSM